MIKVRALKDHASNHGLHIVGGENEIYEEHEDAAKDKERRGLVEIVIATKAAKAAPENKTAKV